MGKLLAAIWLTGLCFSAHAADNRCAVPPYGMAVSDFKRYTETLGTVFPAARFLPPLCNAKYGDLDRTGLYNLGFTDKDIDSKSMSELIVQEIRALKNFADKCCGQ